MAWSVMSEKPMLHECIYKSFENCFGLLWKPLVLDWGLNFCDWQTVGGCVLVSTKDVFVFCSYHCTQRYGSWVAAGWGNDVAWTKLWWMCPVRMLTSCDSSFVCRAHCDHVALHVGPSSLPSSQAIIALPMFVYTHITYICMCIYKYCECNRQSDSSMSQVTPFSRFSQADSLFRQGSTHIL